MEKSEIRKLYLAKRSDLSFKVRDQLSTEIAHRLLNEFDLSNKTVSIFLPIERFKEINTWKIIDQLNAQFVLPVLNGDQLKHIRYEEKAQLKISDWGIPEPTYGDEVAISTIDFVIVPLLAIDKKGYRVGYGKGFYDRFLANCSPNCTFIGLSYFEPIDKVKDTHQADVRLHHCITPQKVITF
ncbi:MAG: 5-formyltetrahydrofolate cyclo-ligase [Crocinitomicaceae bacterium]